VRDELEHNPAVSATVKKTVHAAESWETHEGGGMVSVGFDGSLTGKGFDLGIVDDPHKNWEEANSATYQARVWNCFTSTFGTRSEPGASIVVMLTRWAENDLAGQLMRNDTDGQWEVFTIPALADENDPIGRSPGEALCPARFDEKMIDAQKKLMGSYMFNGMYQQRPSPPEGRIIMRSDVQRWKQLPPRFDRWLQSWDTTFKEESTSWVVGQVWGVFGPDIYLVDQVRGKWSLAGTLEQMSIMRARWPEAVDTLVENKASGPMILDALKGKVPGLLKENPTGDKNMRLISVSGAFESHCVYVPDDSLNNWVGDYMRRLTSYPSSDADDEIDATSQALKRLYRNEIFAEINLSLTSGTQENPWIHATMGLR